MFNLKCLIFVDNDR